MKFSFYHVAQRFSIRKFSFGAASVLLGVFLLSGVQMLMLMSKWLFLNQLQVLLAIMELYQRK